MGIFDNRNGKIGRSLRGDIVTGKNRNVGPGSYEIDSMFTNKRGGYSSGKQEKGLSYGNHNPGPGSYDYNASSMKDGLSYKIGKQRREGMGGSNNPGPGNYESSNFLGNKYGKINPEGREATFFNNPGPGTYDENGKTGLHENFKYSFGKDIKRDLAKGVPGPGTYDGDYVHGKQGIAVGKSPKGFIYGNPNPGPGAYDGDYGNMRYSAGNKYTFGKDRRDHVQVGNKVGPADYDIPASIPDVAKYNYPEKNKRKIHM